MKNGKGAWQQQFQNQEFVLVSQYQNDKIFKQFLVQIKSSKQIMQHEFGICCWPSCTKKTLILPQKKDISRNETTSEQNTKKRRRPDSGYKKHIMSCSHLPNPKRFLEKLTKLPFQLSLELKDLPLLKPLKKYLNKP
jgi:hypothetical protein